MAGNSRVTTVVDDRALRSLLISDAGPIAAELSRRAIRVQNEAKRLAPVDNGTLRASITHELRSPGNAKRLVARVGTNLEYALFVHEGTGIYGPKHRPIKPRTAKVLRWPVRGTNRGGSRTIGAVGFAFAPQVKGVRPRPFLRDALRAAR